MEQRTALAQDQNVIQVPVQDQILSLHVSSVYKHLGIQTTAGLQMGPEVLSETAWFKGHVTPALRKLFAN